MDSTPWLFGPIWLPQDPKVWPHRKFTLEEADKVEFGKEVAAVGSSDQHQVLLATLLISSRSGITIIISIILFRLGWYSAFLFRLGCGPQPGLHS